MANSSTFPAFIRAEYDSSSDGFREFESAFAKSAKTAQDRFVDSFSEVGSKVSKALSRGLNINGALDLDTSSLRQVAADASFSEQALSAMLRTAQALAVETHDNSEETRAYIQALAAQRVEAAANRREADAQVATYTRLQAALDGTSASNSRLADSYRATFAEAAKLARLEVHSNDVNRAYTATYALGSLTKATDNGATTGALQQLAREQDEAARTAAAYDQLRRAEVGVAEGARIVEAALRGTAAALDHNQKSASESARVFEQFHLEAQKAAEHLDVLRRAEVGAAEGSRILQSVYKGTAEEIGRLRNDISQTVAVFEQLANAQAEVANRRFTNFIAPKIDTSALANGAGYQALAEAERAAEQYGRQLAELRQHLDPLAYEQARVNKEIEFAALAFSKGDISAEQYEVQVQRLKGSLSLMNGTMKHSRQGMIMVGQQMQDVAISFIGGQRASTVLSQQLPQLAYAMSNFKGKVGEVATTLSGPWSIALVAGSFLAGLFIDKLTGVDDASKKATKSTADFADVLDWRRMSVVNFKDAIDQLSDATKRLIDTQAIAAETMALNAQSALAAVDDQLADLDKEIKRISDIGGKMKEAVLPDLLQKRSDLLAQRSQAELSVQETRMALQIRSLEETIDTAKGEAAQIQRQIADLKRQRQASLAAESTDPLRAAQGTAANPNLLSEAEFKTRLAALERKLQEVTKRNDGPKPSLSQHTAQEVARFITPVQGGRTSSGLGIRTDPITGKQAGHAGIDIAAPLGTPVSAPAQGTVIEAGTLRGYGKVVFIDHGAGTITRLAHLSKINVAMGDVVNAGQNVGAVGSTGRSTGNHLHWETRVNGKPIDPRGKALPVDPIGSAQESADIMARAQREAEKLQRQIDATVGSVEKLNSEFREAPRDVVRAENAVTKLKKQIEAIEEELKNSGLTNEQREALENSRSSAINTRDNLIPARLKRPFEDELASMQQQKELQDLLLQGRQADYDVMQDKLDLARQLGVQSVEQLAVEIKARGISEDQFRIYLMQRAALRAQSVELEYQQQQQQRLLQVVDEVAAATRNIFYDMFDGKGLNAAKNFFNNMYNIAKKNLADEVYEQVFGDAFQKHKLKILGLDQVDQTGRDMADAISRTIDPIKLFGDTLSAATAKIPSSGGVANDNHPAGAIADIAQEIGIANYKLGLKITGIGDALLAVAESIPDAGSVGDIVVQAAGATSKNTGNDLKVIGDNLSKGLGKNSALAKEIGKFGEIAGGVMKSAAVGEATSGVLKSLGVKQSKTGAQLGAIAGSFIGGPIGSVVGGIIGGTVGGLFKKSKWGTAVVGENSTTSGNSKGYKAASGGAADSVFGSLQNIADALGGEIGNYKVSIGQHKGKWRVSTTGYSGGPLNYKGSSAIGLYDFGKDGAEEAIAFAIRDAINDGAIKGISAAAQRLLKSGKDLDAQLQKALSFESVFTRLKAHKDPIGAALDTLDKEFERLKKIFAEAGASSAEYAQLEELYGIERARAVKEASDRIAASLKALYDDLTMGDNGRSLRDRLSAAQAEYDPLKLRVLAGDTTAYDEFADVARTMLDIQREFSGSQNSYFALLDEITAITKARLDDDAALAGISANRDSPFTPAGSVAANDNTEILGSISQTNAILKAIYNAMLAGQTLPSANGFTTAAFQ